MLFVYQSVQSIGAFINLLCPWWAKVGVFLPWWIGDMLCLLVVLV